VRGKRSVKDDRKTKKELIAELEELRDRVSSLGRDTRAASDDHENIYRRFVELSPDPFLVVQDGIVKYASPSFKEMFGYTQSDLSDNISFMSLARDEDKERVVQRFKDRFDGKELSRTFRIDVVAKDGHMVPCETSATLIDFEGRPADLIIARDLSDSKRAEERLVESEQRFRAVFEQVADSIILVDVDTGSIVDFNELAHKNLGYTREEFEKLTLADIEAVESPEETAEHIRKISEDGCAVFETRNKRKDGELRDVIVNTRVVTFGEKQLFASVLSDVTHRKQYEQRIRFLGIITEQISDSVVATDLDFKVIYTNRSFLQMYGYEPGELDGQSLDVLNAETNAEQIQNEIYQAMLSGKVWTGELLNRRKDGSTFPCEVTVFPLADEEGAVFAYAGIQRDITERKRVETSLRHARENLEIRVAHRTSELEHTLSALRDSEEHLRTILESTADGILVVSRDGSVTHANARFVEMWRIPPELLATGDDEKLLEYAIEQLVDPAIFLDKVHHLYESTELNFDTLNFKDDRVFERFSCPLLKEGVNEGRVWSFRDVTDRHKAQEEIRKFKTISDRANYGAAILSLDGTLLYVNDTLADMTGYTKDEMVGRSLFSLSDAGQLAQRRMLFKLALEEGGFEAEEVLRTEKDGSLSPTLVNATLIKDDSGAPLFLSVTGVSSCASCCVNARIWSSSSRARSPAPNTFSRYPRAGLSSGTSPATIST